MTTFNLGGDAGNSFSFDYIGAQVTGTVLDLVEQQQTDMQTGEPKTFTNGQPMMMYRVDLQTQERDPNNPMDDGRRSVYLKGSRAPETQSSLAAVLAAVKQATGTANIATGGTLTVQYVGDGQPKQRGFSAPKLYAASYQPPTHSLGEEPVRPQQVMAQPSPQQQFAQQQAAQGPAPQWAQAPAQQPAYQVPAAPAQQYPAQQYPVQQSPAPQYAPQAPAPQQYQPQAPAQQQYQPQAPAQPAPAPRAVTLPEGITPEILAAAQQAAAGAQQA